MAMSITSPGLARMPSQAEKIIEKPTSNPISNASRNATKSSASTLDVLSLRRLSPEQPRRGAQPDVHQHQHTGHEHASRRNPCGEEKPQGELIASDFDQPPASWQQDD